MDWIIVAGLMAISLVLCICMLHLTGRLNMLEKDIKRLRGIDQKVENVPSVDRLHAEMEAEVEKYNKSYGDPTVMEWFDKQYEEDDK